MPDNPTIKDLLRRGRERADANDREAERIRSAEVAKRRRDYDLLKTQLAEWLGSELTSKVDLPPFDPAADLGPLALTVVPFETVPIHFGVHLCQGRMMARPGLEGKIRVPSEYVINYDPDLGPVGEAQPLSMATLDTIEDAVYFAWKMEDVRLAVERADVAKQANALLGSAAGPEQLDPNDNPNETGVSPDHDDRSSEIPF